MSPKVSPAGRAAHRIQAREWMRVYRPALPWAVFVGGVLVARFEDERDARGFAIARYKGDAVVKERKRDRRSNPVEPFTTSAQQRKRA